MRRSRWIALHHLQPCGNEPGRLAVIAAVEAAVKASVVMVETASERLCRLRSHDDRCCISGDRRSNSQRTYWSLGSGPPAPRKRRFSAAMKSSSSPALGSMSMVQLLHGRSSFREHLPPSARGAPPSGPSFGPTDEKTGEMCRYLLIVGHPNSSYEPKILSIPRSLHS